MKDIKFLNFNSALILAFFMLILSGCVDPYYNNSGYSGSNYGGYNSGYDSGYNDGYDNNRRERKDLERERRRLEDERRRLEDERRNNQPVYRPPPPPPPAPERCPPGFSPSENKCSVEERRRGCKDMRLPGGLGCVHR